MKYEIEVGAFVEHIAHRKYVINANSPETAFEKARQRFYDDQMRCARNTEVHSSHRDSIKEVGGKDIVDEHGNPPKMEKYW